jgi:hypothetical protein
MRFAESFESLRSIARAAVPTMMIALIFPLVGAELRAQTPFVNFGLTAADGDVIAKHLLTMADFRKLAAIHTRLAELAQRDKKVCALLDAEANSSEFAEPKSIAERVRWLESVPTIRAALQASGVTAREYVVIQLTHTTALLENTAGLVGQRIFSDPVNVNPANREFLRVHEEEITELFESITDPCSDSW